MAEKPEQPDQPESAGQHPNGPLETESHYDARQLGDHPRDHQHRHAHDHDHDHDDPFHVHPTRELDVESFDPASRSLAEALRISFNVLKVVVVVLLVVFLFVSGYREIQEGQVGIRLRFGAPVGEWLEGGERFAVDVLEGPQFALPEPIERIVIVPTKDQGVTINEAFWFEADPGVELSDLPTPAGGLQPGRDGSLITADKNIVHGRFRVNYVIRPADAADFAINVGAADVTESLRRAEAIVREAVEQAILEVVAATEVDAFVQGQVDRQAILESAQGTLDRMRSGITVSEVFLVSATPPPGEVLQAFNRVNSAESQRDTRITNARREAERTLIRTAGQGYPWLLEAIEAYDAARRADADAETTDAAWRRVEQMLSSRAAMTANNLGGEVAQIIDQAESDRARIAKSVQGEAEAFLRQFEKYRDNPRLKRIIVQRLWQDTVQEILQGEIELMYLSPRTDNLYLEIGRNRELLRARQERQREEAIRAAAEQQQQ
jgi:regulator of protease activity HflC (stomatin/prohibitin superfamily)